MPAQALTSVQRTLDRPTGAGHGGGRALQRDVLALQRTAGNAAVQRLLAPHSPGAAGAGPLVQRYPDTVFQQPYRGWQAATESVFSPGRGLMGGVLILKGRGGRMFGPVPDVVVKPLRGQGKVLGADGFSSPEQSQMGDVVLREFGIDTPDSRVIMPGAPEYSMLKTLSEEGSGKQFENDVNSIKLMSKVQGEGLKEIAQGPQGGHTKADIERLVEVLGDPRRFYKIGETMVADTLMNNADRITNTMTAQKLNLDNIMVTLDSFVAIDTAAVLMESAFGKELDLTLLQGMLNETKVRELLNGVFEIITGALAQAQGAPQGFQPLQYFNTRFTDGDVALMKGWIMDGIAGGKQKVRAFATSKEGPDRERRQRLKAQAGTKYSEEGSLQSSYTTLKARAIYMTKFDELIEGGVERAVAQQQAKEFAQSYANSKVNEWRREEVGNYPLSEHMQRVLVGSGLSETDVLTVKMGLKRGGVAVSDQDKMLHIRPYGAKVFQKGNVDTRLEAIRAGIMKRFAIHLADKGDRSDEELKEVVDTTYRRAKLILDLRVYEPKPSNKRLTAIQTGLVRALNNALGDRIMADHFPAPK